MAKFNTYGYTVRDQESELMDKGEVQALGHEQAWLKVVTLAFEHRDPAVGSVPTEIHVWLTEATL